MVGGGVRWLVSVEWGVVEETVVPLCFLGHVVCFCVSCSCLAFGVVVEVAVEKAMEWLYFEAPLVVLFRGRIMGCCCVTWLDLGKYFLGPLLFTIPSCLSVGLTL